MSNKYILEFTLTGEGSITAESEEAAQTAIKAVLEKCVDQLGTELAKHSELVHITARPLHTLRIIKEAVAQS